MSKVVLIGGNGTAPGRSLYFWCPGCDHLHRVTIDAGEFGWVWDGNEQLPTVTPSVLTTYGPRSDEANNRVCHLFVRTGQLEFLPDSTHGQAGQTVTMAPLPDWVTAEYVG
jgi:hypothetical protein